MNQRFRKNLIINFAARLVAQKVAFYAINQPEKDFTLTPDDVVQSFSLPLNLLKYDVPAFISLYFGKNTIDLSNPTVKKINRRFKLNKELPEKSFNRAYKKFRPLLEQAYDYMQISC